MSTTTTHTEANIFLDMEQVDRLIYALMKSRNAAARDVANYGHEGIEARVMLTAEAQSNGSARLRIQTMESWITSFTIDDMDVENI